LGKGLESFSPLFACEIQDQGKPSHGAISFIGRGKKKQSFLRQDDIEETVTPRPTRNALRPMGLEDLTSRSFLKRRGGHLIGRTYKGGKKNLETRAYYRCLTGDIRVSESSGD